MTPEQLKMSILQYAIQGKLVEQKPEEGSAVEVYKKVQDNYKQENNKKKKILPEIIDEEKPFEIPDVWKWVRIGDICNIINGFTPKRSTPDFWINGTIPWFTIEDVRKQGRFIEYTEQFITDKALSKDSNRIVPAETVLLCCTASVGEYAYTKIPLTTNQQFNALVIKNKYKEFVSSMYIYEFVQTLKWQLLSKAGKTTFNFLSVGKLSKMIMPVPPLEEQHRIVAKIEELLPLVDQYAKSYEKLEHFNAKFPEEMKKSILQYAIQGKLVEQREEEGTAEELYQQIQSEKQKLIEEGKIKKEKPLPEISEDEIPFDIPENWRWVHLRDICSLIADVDHNMPKAVPESEGKLFLSAKDLLDDGTINYTDNVKYISYEDFDRLSKKAKPTLHDIVYSRIGAALGKARVVYSDREFIVSYSCCVIRTFIDEEYLRYYLESPFILRHSVLARQSIGVPDLGMGEIKQYIVALPPLEEQQRIVAKIDELLPYCDRLSR